MSTTLSETSPRQKTQSKPNLTQVFIALAIANVLASAVPASIRSPWPSLFHFLISATALAIHGHLVLAKSKTPLVIDRTSWWIITLALVGACAFAPADSYDVYSYGIYGWILFHYKASPYTQMPVEFLQDPVAQRSSVYWIGTPSVYGPVFTVISALLMSVAYRSGSATSLAFQILSLIAVASTVWVLHRYVKRPDIAMLYACSPIAVVSLVNGGHNDALVALAIICGIELFKRGLHYNAAAVFALGACVKLTGLLAPFALGVLLLKNKQWRTALMFGFIVLAIAGGLHFLFARDIVEPLGKASKLLSGGSIWSWLSTSLNVFVGEIKVGKLLRTPSLASVTFVLLLAYLFIKTKPSLSPEKAVACTYVIYLTTSRYTLPWYIAWFLPLAWIAFSHRTQIWTTVYASALYLCYTSRPGARPSWLLGIQQLTLHYVVPLIGIVVLLLVLTEETKEPAPSSVPAP